MGCIFGVCACHCVIIQKRAIFFGVRPEPEKCNREDERNSSIQKFKKISLFI